MLQDKAIRPCPRFCGGFPTGLVGVLAAPAIRQQQRGKFGSIPTENRDPNHWNLLLTGLRVIRFYSESYIISRLCIWKLRSSQRYANWFMTVKAIHLGIPFSAWRRIVFPELKRSYSLRELVECLTQDDAPWEPILTSGLINKWNIQPGPINLLAGSTVMPTSLK